MLKGERLTLRGIQRDDLPRLWQFDNDLDVELAGGGDPPLPRSLESMQASYDKAASEGKRDPWFAIDLDGKVIGICGFKELDECGGVNLTAELGISIGDKDCWSQGYGREAVELLLRWAFRYRNLRRVWLRVRGDNDRAWRCYEACGFVHEGRMRQHDWHDGKYVDLLFMGLLREEWLERTTPSTETQ
jgi:RimJ/RimL family protein N-acetyltransferase